MNQTVFKRLCHVIEKRLKNKKKNPKKTPQRATGGGVAWKPATRSKSFVTFSMFNIKYSIHSELASVFRIQTELAS